MSAHAGEDVVCAADEAIPAQLKRSGHFGRGAWEAHPCGLRTRRAAGVHRVRLRVRGSADEHAEGESSVTYRLRRAAA
jgi:hypothetical protein